MSNVRLWQMAAIEVLVCMDYANFESNISCPDSEPKQIALMNSPKEIVCLKSWKKNLLVNLLLSLKFSLTYMSLTFWHRSFTFKFHHSVCKMWTIQEPKTVALWNKWHFEEKNIECAACLKYAVLIFVEKIFKKMQYLDSGTSVLYIGRTVLIG
jgi:hypothetical protein